MNLRAYTLGEQFEASSLDASKMAGDWFTDEVMRWIDVSAPDVGEMVSILDPLELHRDVKAATVAEEKRALVIAFEHQLFVRLPYLGDDGKIEALRLICGPTALVSLQTEPMKQIEYLAENLLTGERKVEPCVGDLFVEIFEAVFREARPASNRLRDEVRALSDSLESERADFTVGDLLGLKRRTSGLVDLIEDQILCLGQISALRARPADLSGVKEDLTSMLKFLEQIRPIVIRLDGQVRELREAYDGLLQEKTNRRLNMLAVLSAIYLPPTLIAGMYGMNFEKIPITGIPGGYFVVVVLMVALVVGQLAIFWRRGWFR